MQVLDFMIEWLPTPLLVWLIGVMLRKSLRRRFPCFFLYATYITPTHLLRQILFGTSAHFWVYWSTEAVSFILSLLAVYENFQALFGDYRRFAWFRWLWPGTIAIIWAYSVWRAWVHPPASGTRAGALLISVALSSAYTIVGLMVVFFVLAGLVLTRWYPYEFHIVGGLGLASLGMVASAVTRAQFRGRFAWFSAFAYPIASLLAVTLWVRGFLIREAPIRVEQSPEVLLQEMNQDFKIVKRIDDSVTPWRNRRQ